ncbi:hydroxymethylbilane synthase [Actinoallomurus sp. CA-150999]|uniref:hydroxymethylbilane synthase n=1 Tax=Actinoallomurus sp. CA-150999 TaxID=3239887 RepID=UPI003D89EDEA
MLPDLRIRIGSRTSPMALAQANQVRDLLTGQVDGLEAEIVGIQTSGDRWQGDLAELGGKSAFLKEIDRHLLSGDIDIAVHCMKDVPGDVPLPEGTAFAAYLEREDAHDVIVFPSGSPYGSVDELPAGARVATSAVRRKAQILRVRPDLRVDRIRGNVNSRLARFDTEQQFDAMILARAGLRRIGMEDRVGQVLPVETMCPAIGAGVIGVQCRTADTGVMELVRLLDHAETRTHVTAERTMLQDLQGHCNSPIAGHCTTAGDGRLSLIGMVFSPDGGTFAYAHEWDKPDRAPELGAYVAATLVRKGAHDIIGGIPH